MSCLAMLSGERFCDRRSKACSMAAIVWGSCFVSSVSTRIHTRRTAYNGGSGQAEKSMLAAAMSLQVGVGTGVDPAPLEPEPTQ
jgi:hypothetical protein